MTGCFSTAYLPPADWFQTALSYPGVLLEACESWQKQSYRNRCYISAPNGIQMLNIPIAHPNQSKKLADVQISYRENWRHQHWQAIQTAYGSTPFFEVLAPELEPYYHTQPRLLIDWNHGLIKLLLYWLQAELNIEYTSEWVLQRPNDHRQDFHPKQSRPCQIPSYPRPFKVNEVQIQKLSAIDLIFNEGPAAYDYLVS